MEIITWFGKTDQEGEAFLLAEDMVGALLEQKVREPDSPRPNMRALAKSTGFAVTDREYNAHLRDVALGLVHRQLIMATTHEQDLLQSVEALDDLTFSINLLSERLYEWSRLHHQEIVHGIDLAKSLCEDDAMGILARSVLGLMNTRTEMERDVSISADSLAPNLSCLAGPILAARLISRAGDLHRLAEMPSSRIQVLGAEKSLFKHLKGQAPSPKHGLIYRHPSVIGSPKRLRGKVARTLAGKLVIAARLDYFGSGLSPDLKKTLERRLADIKAMGKISRRKNG